MAYKILCDNFPLLDLRDDELIVENPEVNLEVNKVGEASFTIYSNHPYYNQLQRMKSIFEISDDVGAIFRGRMTDDTKDFENRKAIDLEGLMAFFNDSIIRPYVFPDDFKEDEKYIAAAVSGNVVEFFLNWLLESHNSQVQGFQRFKLGKVTVTDKNNFLERSNEHYESTWANLQSRLFNSALGGNLCIRYEADGNYIDYLAEFEETNTQEIVFGENLLDITNEITAAETYSAMIPLGKETQQATGDSYEGDYVEIVDTVTKRLTLESLTDGDISDDIAKMGDTIYSRSAVAQYGWICKVVEWDDVTVPENLLEKAIEQLTTDGIMLSNTIEARAVDLHFSDSEIESFRMYRNVVVRSVPHNLSSTYQLSKLSIPLLNPQNTEIKVGKTQKTLLDMQYEKTNMTYQQLKRTEESVNEAVQEIKILTERLEDTNGNVTEIMKTAGEVYVVVENNDGTLSSVVNPDQISITKLDKSGNIVSGFYYDTEEGEFKFYGSGEFRSAAEDGSYIRIENDEIVLYSNDGTAKTRIGFVSSGSGDFPYILLGNEELEGYVGLVKRFADGVWFGNSVPKNDTGNFECQEGASGFFINTEENKAYIVAGTEKMNLYTGEAVARFA